MGLHTVNRYFDLYDWEVILKCDFLVTKIYVKNGGFGYSNRFVSVPSLLSADNQSNGINTFDDYINRKSKKDN